MIEETYNHDSLECPYCHHKDMEPYELGSPDSECGTTECVKCEREYRWVRCLTVTYTGKPMEDKP
jgi:hypothetical protein